MRILHLFGKKPNQQSECFKDTGATSSGIYSHLSSPLTFSQ